MVCRDSAGGGDGDSIGGADVRLAFDGGQRRVRGTKQLRCYDARLRLHVPAPIELRDVSFDCDGVRRILLVGDRKPYRWRFELGLLVDVVWDGFGQWRRQPHGRRPQPYVSYYGGRKGEHHSHGSVHATLRRASHDSRLVVVGA